MSQIDSTFAGIPAPILAKWGQDITFLKTSTTRTYNPTTGTVSGSDVSITVKVVLNPVSSRESEGLYQSTDIKIIMGNAELGSYYPTEQDRVCYTQNGITREAKIINVTTYRGEGPILHNIIARPQ